MAPHLQHLNHLVNSAPIEFAAIAFSLLMLALHLRERTQHSGARHASMTLQRVASGPLLKALSEEVFDFCEHLLYAGTTFGSVAKEIQQFGPEFHTRLARPGDPRPRGIDVI